MFVFPNPSRLRLTVTSRIEVIPSTNSRTARSTSQLPELHAVTAIAGKHEQTSFTSSSEILSGLRRLMMLRTYSISAT
eukprot:762733-Hanusia_phi.AAC.6